MTCFMFPGQPVTFSYAGSGDDSFRAVCESCHAVTGWNPLDTSTSAGLSESVRLQLFGVCASIDRLSRQLQHLGPPAIIAEHSMGIYPALAACGAVDTAAAIELVWRIGSCLASMGRARDYALGSVIGLSLDPLAAIAANNGAYIANFNTSRHFLLSGRRESVESALVEAEAGGAFSVGLFPCDAPLHTPLLQEVRDELEDIANGYGYREPCFPLVESRGQSLLAAESIAPFLVAELLEPVFWERTYRFLRERGVSRFVETGCGTSLTKFNRWIESES